MGPRLRGDDRDCCTRVRIHARCVHTVCPYSNVKDAAPQVPPGAVIRSERGGPHDRNAP